MSRCLQSPKIPARIFTLKTFERKGAGCKPFERAQELDHAVAIVATVKPYAAFY